MTDERELPTELERRLYEVYLDQGAAERSRDLDALCAEHPRWAGALRTLAAELATSDRLLGPIRTEAERPVHPERIGDYAILEELGSGGFGVVYRAEQLEPVRRIVALKLLRPGVSNARTLARFEAERQALAGMDHPAIAKVFDAGTTPDGQPYLAMELVDGQPITTWCDEHRVDVRARLRLLLEVCAAVQHAHQKNVVHRDLKPSNVLVREQDGEPMPKVIDFGIAKVLDEERAERSLATADGALIGTPEYMSPEQAAGRPVDTRADVYALGVLLFELSTGELPFERERIRTSNLGQVVRIICEEDPRRPSEALLAEADTAVAAARRDTTAAELLSHLRNDLDWIVLKALERDPDTRYASVGSFATDVGRFLASQPVLARRAASWYVARKFMARHRVGVAIGGFLLAVVVLGVVALVWGLVQIETARRDEVAQRHRATAHEYSARIMAADAAIKLHNTVGGRRHLSGCAPELRGFEWHHLQLKLDDSRVTLPGHDGAYCSQVRWLADGAGIVTVGHDGIRWWNARDGSTLRPARTWSQDIRIALSPDRRVIAAPVGATKIELLDAMTGDTVDELECPEPVGRPWLKFSPDGSRLFAGTRRRDRVCVFDLADPASPRIVSSSGELYALGPDGSWGIVTSLSGTGAAIWDVATERSRVLDAGRGDRLTSAAVSGDGRLVAWGTEGAIRIHDVATGALLHQLSGHHGRNVFALRFHGDRLLSGGEDSAVQVWDFARGVLVEVLLGSERTIHDLDVSPDGGEVAAVTSYQGARVWRLGARQHRVDLRAHDGASPAIVEIQWTADSSRVLTTSEDGTVGLWDATSLSRLATLRVGARPTASALSPDGRILATACGGTAATPVVLWEPESGETTPLRAPGHGARDVAWSKDGGRVASGGHDRTVRIWDVASRELVRTIDGHGSIVRSVCFGPGGGEIWSGSLDGWIRAFDAATGAELRRFPTKGGPNVLRLNRDGTRLISAEDQLIVQRAVPSGDVLRVYSGHRSWCHAAAFAPDRSRLVSASHDGTIRLWDAASGEDLLVLDVGGWQYAARFSPDGKRLATGGERGVLSLWESEQR